MRVVGTSVAFATLLRSLVDAGSDQAVRIQTNTNDVTVATQAKYGSAINLLDRAEFFVCSSFVDGMDGRYVLYEDSNMQSDAGTPVFVREDDEEEETGRSLATTGQAKHEHDFRLFRRNGFWMFADVAPWPPTTLFRCDPTKNHVPEIDFAGVCGMNLDTPPLLGYSPVDAEHHVMHLALRTDSFGAGDDDGAALERVVVVQTNLSGRKDEL